MSRRTPKCPGCGRPDYPRCPQCGRIVYPRYVGADLTPQEWRNRRHLERATVYDHDLDAMDAVQLKAFLAVYGWNSRVTMYAMSEKLFPGKPIGYVKAAKLLLAMAKMRLNALLKPERSGFWLRRYELAYSRLPKFARWRSVYNLGHCSHEKPGKALKNRKVLDILAPEKTIDSKEKAG